MNTEENKHMKEEEVNEHVHTDAEHALGDQHNPDLGSPEPVSADAEPISAEAKWQKEANEWKDKYLRLFAEFDNFRKRSQKERADLISTASADVIKGMLPVMDDFDRAVKANEQFTDIEAVKEGFILIHQKFYRNLEARGLKPLDARGKVFDTDFHEAITQIPAPSPDMVGKVVDEVEKGYMLNEKVIRFSKVVIGQ